MLFSGSFKYKIPDIKSIYADASLPPYAVNINSTSEHFTLDSLNNITTKLILQERRGIERTTMRFILASVIFQLISAFRSSSNYAVLDPLHKKLAFTTGANRCRPTLYNNIFDTVYCRSSSALNSAIAADIADKNDHRISSAEVESFRRQLEQRVDFDVPISFSQNDGDKIEEPASTPKTSTFASLLDSLVPRNVLLFSAFGTMVRSILKIFSFKAFTRWYLTNLEIYPLLTKALTAGAMGILGDLIAQNVERKWGEKPKDQKYCYRRTAALFFDGLYGGPVMHYAYAFFESMIPTANTVGIMSILSPLSHCIADSIVVDSFFVGTMFFTSGLFEGLSLFDEIIPQIKRDYFTIMRAAVLSSLSLVPLEFMIFRFFPIAFRPLCVNFLDIFWTAVVSFVTHRGRSLNHHASDVAGDDRIQGSAAFA